MSRSSRQFRSVISSVGCLMVYGAVLMTLTAAAESENFWSELLDTPRFRTGFLFYSAAFTAPSTAVVMISCWQPATGPARWIRRGLLGLAILAMLAAELLLFAVGDSWDSKMSM